MIDIKHFTVKGNNSRQLTCKYVQIFYFGAISNKSTDEILVYFQSIKMDNVTLKLEISD